MNYGMYIFINHKPNIYSNAYVGHILWYDVFQWYDIMNGKM